MAIISFSGKNNGTRTDESSNAVADPIQCKIVPSSLDIGEISRDFPADSDSESLVKSSTDGARSRGPMTQGNTVICLTQGTLIDTPTGERLIEDLEIGDLVRTLENGAQPVRLVHCRKVSGDAFKAQRKLWPVCIQAGSLGFGLPHRNLRVSPEHRILYNNIRIPLHFGEDAVFVRAKSLAASFEQVYVDSSLDEVTYYHLVFDRHEVIFAEGTPTESFHCGPEGIANLDEGAREELFSVFPNLRFSEKEVETGFQTIRSWELRAAVS
jgi:hypothetical protein